MATSNKKTLTAEDLGLNNVPVRIPTIITGKPTITTTRLKYEILSEKKVRLDAAKSAEYIDLPVFKGERTVTDEGVQRVLDEMQQGTFNQSNVILASAWLGDVRYKINGQHTAWAASYFDVNDGFIVSEIIYRVKNPEQLKLLYNTYDRNRPRTDTFTLGVLLTDTDYSEGLHQSQLTTYSNGLKFWKFGDDSAARKRMSPNQMNVVVRDNQELYQAVGRFLQQDSQFLHRGIRRQCVIGAMFATFSKSVAKSVEFWSPICTGLGLTSKNDPRWRLKEYLDRTVSNAGVTNIRKDKDVLVMGHEGIYRVCIVCWNKWRRGETMSVTPRATPKRINPI